MKYITRIKEYENGERLEFKVEIDNIYETDDIEKINNLLDKLIDNQKDCNNMLRNVSFIRTILRDYEEKLLVVKYSNLEGINEIVKYDNGNLYFYEYDIENKDGYMNLIYEPKNLDDCFKFIMSNNKDDFSKYPRCYSKEIASQFDGLLQNIYKLIDIKGITIDDECKKLIEIYKYFYNEAPNFSDKNINIKIQIMMNILYKFGIKLADGYIFCPYSKGGLPISLEIEHLVNSLFPLGEISEIYGLDMLSIKEFMIISIISKNIMIELDNVDNKEETLMLISKIIHASGYDFYSSINFKKMLVF